MSTSAGSDLSFSIVEAPIRPGRDSLQSGQAVIHKRVAFTIRLKDRGFKRFFMANDFFMAKEIATYVTRRNQRQPQYRTTLRMVCRRFRLRQADAVRIIESVSFLVLSPFAYKPPALAGDDWAAQITASWFPQEWTEAPLGVKLVAVLDSEEEFRGVC